MPVLLITGPHQAGKSRALWRRLRAEPAGAAVLVTADGRLTHETVRQIHAWTGSGLLPPVIALGELLERCAASAAEQRVDLGEVHAEHLLRPWAREGLAETPWGAIAGYRVTARELARLCLRCDEAAVTVEDLRTLAVAARSEGEGRAADELLAVAAGRVRLGELATRSGRASVGARALALASAGPALPWAAIYGDDLISLRPAWIALLAALAGDRRVVLTAVDDDRLGSGSLCDRLRRGFPAASEERLAAAHPGAPTDPALRQLFADALRPDAALPGAMVDRYRYRDATHAGRAIAAWLRRQGIAPNRACVYVRACDGEALALADALAAAEVPVAGVFQVPYAGTAGGGMMRALAGWCADPSWQALLGVAGRLSVAEPETAPPELAADLEGPWNRLPAEQALAKLAGLSAQDEDGWSWQERGPTRGERPRLQALIGWLRALLVRLRAEGSPVDRLSILADRFPCGAGASDILRQVRELDALGGIGAAEFEDAISAATIEVRRGDDLVAASCLRIRDAVRGRSQPSDIVIIHGLEHGRWPARPRAGSLLSVSARARLATDPDRDPLDEAGRASGEIAAFLAVCARARARVVLGIPCGEREPSPWLSTLAGQLGWDLEAERAAADADAAPGAPLSPADSQGAHERALWQSRSERCDFRFRIPAAAPRFSPSELDTLLQDPFCLACERLPLLAPLQDRRRQRDGEELHALLAGLIRDFPSVPERWEEELSERLHPWVAVADPFIRIDRTRLARGVLRAIAKDAALLPPGSRSEAEQPVTVVATVAGERIELRGRVDRLDLLPDGRRWIVDYKSGSIASYARALKDGCEGQLLAYASAFSGQLAGAHYRSLRDATLSGYRGDGSPWEGGPRAFQGVPTAELPGRLAALYAAMAAFSAGDAATTADGLCATRGFAAIARTDEARLDLEGDAPPSEEAE